MRVLLTTDTLGGVWTFTSDLARELLSRGHAIALISFGRAPSPAQSSFCAGLRLQYGEDFRYDSSGAPLEWMTNNTFCYDEALPFLLQVVEEFSPDLIHSNQFCFGDLPLTIPTVVTAHSDVLSWAAACRPDGLKPSPWLGEYCYIVQRGLQAASTVIAPTLWMLDALRQNFVIGREAGVIANGRNLSSPPAKERALQAISCGRLWDEAKNLSLLTHVAATIPVLVAGEHHYENAVADHGPLRTLGYMQESDLLNLFRGSAIYIAPSIYEPFGLAPLEAAQCGCAILANDIPSLREVWGDAAVYFDDAASLTEVLDHLYRSPADLRSARICSTLRAAEFTATRMADQYLAVYQRLLPRASSIERELALHAR